MSIASEITRIKTNISNAYDKCEAKGATIPTDKNSANLATTIDSITGGGTADITVASPYADEDGKFVKPAEWDDIESIPLSETDQVLYLLYDNTIDFSWCSMRANCNTGNTVCEYGRVVNGQFQVLDSETQGNNYTYRKNFTTEYPNEDYIVVRIRPASNNNLTMFGKEDWTYNNRKLEGAQQPILMQYGSLPYVTSIDIKTYGLVSDNIQNLRAITTLNQWCYLCRRLVRHRHTGWNTTNVTTANAMFQNCESLSDVDSFENFFTGIKLTNINAMFNVCKNLNELNVTGWNTANITNLNLLFGDCIHLKRIIGIEGWYLPKWRVTSSNRDTFLNCYSLTQNSERKLDLSNWRVAESITTTTAPNTVFSNCQSLKEIDISTWNLRYCTSLASLCVNNYSLMKLSLPPDIGASGALTTVENMITYAFNLKEIDLSSIDFAKRTNTATTLNVCSSIINLKSPKNIAYAWSVGGLNRLTRESLLDIFNNLTTLTSAKTLTIGAINLSKLSVEDIAIATGKGWSLA